MTLNLAENITKAELVSVACNCYSITDLPLERMSGVQDHCMVNSSIL